MTPLPTSFDVGGVRQDFQPLITKTHQKMINISMGKQRLGYCRGQMLAHPPAEISRAVPRVVIPTQPAPGIEGQLYRCGLLLKPAAQAR